jgi:hypothetical protein
LDTHQNWEQKQTRGLKFERDFWYGPKKGEIVKGERRKEELKSRREILYLFIIIIVFFSSFLPKKKLFRNCFNFFLINFEKTNEKIACGPEGIYVAQTVNSLSFQFFDLVWSGHQFHNFSSFLVVFLLLF